MGSLISKSKSTYKPGCFNSKVKTPIVPLPKKTETSVKQLERSISKLSLSDKPAKKRKSKNSCNTCKHKLTKEAKELNYCIYCKHNHLCDNMTECGVCIEKINTKKNVCGEKQLVLYEKMNVQESLFMSIMQCNGFEVIPQQPVSGTRMRRDFVIKKNNIDFAVELDGPHHFTTLEKRLNTDLYKTYTAVRIQRMNYARISLLSDINDIRNLYYKFIDDFVNNNFSYRKPIFCNYQLIVFYENLQGTLKNYTKIYNETARIIKLDNFDI